MPYTCRVIYDMMIDLSFWYKSSLTPQIELLQKAISLSEIIEFTYYSPRGESRRRMEPYLLVFQWSSWYIWGYCLEKSDFRLFKLNRMLGSALTGMLPCAVPVAPHGGKPGMYLVEELEDREFLRELMLRTSELLPVPKPKKRKEQQ